MAYSDFDMATVRTRFGLTVSRGSDLFADTPEADPPSLLKHFLKRWLQAALASNSEKARSELIVTPILLEVVERLGGRVNFFSGVTLDVDRARGLNGVCDYLLTASEEHEVPDAPVVAIVEAKREDTRLGFGQCAAALVGAQLLNSTNPVLAGRPVTGAVTSGTDWKFLRLTGTTLAIDSVDYFLPQLPKILGILVAAADPLTPIAA